MCKEARENITDIDQLEEKKIECSGCNNKKECPFNANLIGMVAAKHLDPKAQASNMSQVITIAYSQIS